MDDNLAPETYLQLTTDLLIFLIPKMFKLYEAVRDLAADYFQQP